MNEENYIIEKETTDISKKQEYWDTGIGLNKVDNLEPSKYLIDLSEKNINGELKYNEIEDLLKTYYETKDQNDIKIQREKECDIVSLRIAQLLEDDSFG
ncbi:MAG: antitoxin VbhA family protein, partial [Clostridia bacterium]|nr:antitoxin VbhA family protein [Clostridia bacterium]